MRTVKHKYHNLLWSIAIFVLFSVSVFVFRNIVMDSYRNFCVNLVKTRTAEQAVSLQSRLEARFRLLELFSRGALLNNADGGFNEQNLSELFPALVRDGEYVCAGIANASGDCITNDGARFSIKNERLFTECMMGRRVVEYRQIPVPGSAQMCLALAIPVSADAGSISGCAFLCVDLNAVSRDIEQSTLQSGRCVFLCRPDGEVIAKNVNASFLGTGNVLGLFLSSETRSSLAAGFAAGSSDTFVVFNTGKDRIVSFVPLSGGEICLFEYSSLSALFEQSDKLDLAFVVFTLVLCVLMASFYRIILHNDKRSDEDDKFERELLRQSEERYRLIEDLSDSVLFDGDLWADTLRFNKNYEAVFKTELLFHKVSDMKAPNPLVHSADRDGVARFGEAMLSGAARSSVEFRMKNSAGEYSWYKMESVSIKDANNIPCRFVGKITDIDEQKRKLQYLQSQAERDLLTGIFNHVSTKSKINDYLLFDGHNGAHALFILDIDNFKTLNDTHGHYAGDTALAAVAKCLVSTFRVTDIVGRLGGDEFIVFMKDANNAEYVSSRADDICRAIRALDAAGDGSIRLTCSVGAAFYSAHGKNYDELYKSADAALYSAKERGKDGYCVYKSADEAE